jgi:uncharacterized membrane protein
MKIMKRLLQSIQALILIGMVCTPVNAAKYKFTTIDVPNFTDTQLVGINDAGQISGSCGFKSQNIWHGTFYSHGQFTTFDVPGTAGTTHGGGINALGRIVGYYNDTAGIHGFQYDPGNSVNPFVNPLDADLNVSTFAYGINSQSTIVGYFSTSPWDSFGFSYAGGTWQTFSVPGATATLPTGINDAGEILGFYGNPPDSLVEHGFILSNGVYTFIDNPEADGTILYAKNAANQIVGACKNKDIVGSYHGFLYDGKTFTTIEPPGATQSWAKGINKWGQIVGQYIDQNGDYHGFLAKPSNGLSGVYQLLLLD